MNTLVRGTVAALAVAASLLLVPQAGALTSKEQDQFRTDPLGAVL